MAEEEQNHPFKNIDPRCSSSLKLANTMSGNDGYVDFENFSYLDKFKVQSFNNNLIKTEVDRLNWVNNFHSFITNKESNRNTAPKRLNYGKDLHRILKIKLII